ncbi:MAG: hypothetical protein LBC18_00575 [Opitutaceae bacterium]|jgi:hypothetical protein|nr:hypothetical protein [Opitutaceae bacterium]
MDHDKNAKFFRPSPSLKLPVIGGLVGLIGLAINPVFGISVLIIVILITVALFSGRPSEDEIDRQAGEFIKNIKAEALRKTLLEEEQLSAEPIFFWNYQIGPAVLTDPAVAGLQDKRGGDGRWRSPHVEVTAFLFTESAIHYYRKISSLVSDATKVTTDELYYKHVTGVTSDSKEYKIEQGDQTVQGNVVVLRSGGESFFFNAPDNDSAERAAMAVKSLLRQKNA